MTLIINEFKGMKNPVEKGMLFLVFLIVGTIKYEEFAEQAFQYGCIYKIGIKICESRLSDSLRKTKHS